LSTVTPNFNWPVPTSTDLVKDGATAIEALGDSIDASLVDLKGGTTGQVLAKATNTDMDFAWVAQDDSNAIQNSIVDAKGDLIAASANDTPARLAVGSNGETLVADSSTSTGLRYTANFAAGKNKIINGDFGIWQRGTSFTNPGNGAFTTDRWKQYQDGTVSQVISQQAFTPGTAPVAGYEGSFFWRKAISSSSGNAYNNFEQPIEDVRTFAGQTATVSFYAKADTTRNITVQMVQVFGTGGSGNVTVTSPIITLTTSWARYSATFNVPSISGKTIGTNNFVNVSFNLGINTALTIDLWGIQAEAGSVATAFQTATGTIQGELAACQRYYSKSYPQTIYADGVTNSEGSGQATAVGASNLFSWTAFKVTMRSAPTVSIYAGAGGSGAGSARNNTTGPVVTGIAVGIATQEGFTNLAKTSAFTAGNIFGFEYVASAEL
jgi:hypothetical protein